jgi:hypothetical protein
MARLTTLLVVVLVGLPGCVSTGLYSTNYDGKDAGFLVTALGAQSGTVYDVYDLYFRKKDRSFDGRVLWGQNNFLDDRKPDFDDGTKVGIVDVVRLPPGDYELYNFRLLSRDFYVGTRKARREFKSKQDFALPFTIRTGAGTYIGEFLAVGIKGQDTTPAGAYFLLSNMADRDLPIAKRKQPALAEVAAAVPDLRSFGNPLIKAAAR